MPIDLTKLAEMRAELDARGRALDDRMVIFRQRWAPAVFEMPQFGAELLELCEAWGKWGADCVLCEMVQQLGSGGGPVTWQAGAFEMAGKSGSGSRGSTKRARSTQKQDGK